MPHDNVMITDSGRGRAWYACLAACIAGALLIVSGAGMALGLKDLSDREAAAGLREALVAGSRKAVQTLGKPDGFLGDSMVRIGLPVKFARAERALRTVGMGRQVDDLVTTMNRAAEAAVAEATALLIDAARRMSVQDAKAILTGGDDAATQYFKRTTSGPLAERFLPIVRRATEKVKVAESYNKLAGSAAGMGLIDRKDAELDRYITQKALDGLFLKMAEEEKAIRKDPVRAGTDIVKRVFGAIPPP